MAVCWLSARERWGTLVLSELPDGLKYRKVEGNVKQSDHMERRGPPVLKAS